jgi:hypothetical protein
MVEMRKVMDEYYGIIINKKKEKTW